MRYSEEQLKTINNMKLYLKGMRELSREREYLLEEFNEEPAPHSPSFEETKGTSFLLFPIYQELLPFFCIPVKPIPNPTSKIYTRLYDSLLVETFSESF